MQNALMAKNELDVGLKADLAFNFKGNENSNYNMDLAYFRDYTDHYHHYYPSTTLSTCYHPDKNTFEQAFKVVRRLIDKNLLKLKTVKDFIDAVSEVQDAL